MGVGGRGMILTDYPMKCCGMVEASGFSFYPFTKEGGYLTEEQRQANWDTLFNLIEEHQKKHRRNCAMITLAAQPEAEAQAINRGWTKVFEFYNPNSENMVKIYTKVLWKSEAEYYQAKEDGYPEPARDLWTRKQPDVEHTI
jgi:hypothetical protein